MSFSRLPAAFCVALACAGSAGTAAAYGRGKATDQLPPAQFLEQIRRPFRSDAWGRFSGRITHVRDKQRTRKAAVRISVVFAPDVSHAEVSIDNQAPYTIIQTFTEAAPGQIQLQVPENEGQPSLFDLGIQPEDITLSFVNWDLREELTPESFRRQRCRRLKLGHPNGKDHVIVWFSAKEGFPLKAQWFRAGADAPWRRLEFKGAKKHGGDFWFVKQMRLDGEGWKTQVIFADAEFHDSAEQAAPLELLSQPAAQQEAGP